MKTPTQPNTQAHTHAGWTALMIATYFGFPQVVQALLEHGANTQNQNVRGETARDILCHKTAEAAKHMQCKKLIREHEEKQQKLAKESKDKAEKDKEKAKQQQQQKQPTKADVDVDTLRRRERELDEKERNLAEKEKAATGAAGLRCCCSRVAVLFSFFVFGLLLRFSSMCYCLQSKRRCFIKFSKKPDAQATMRLRPLSTSPLLLFCCCLLSVFMIWLISFV